MSRIRDRVSGSNPSAGGVEGVERRRGQPTVGDETRRVERTRTRRRRRPRRLPGVLSERHRSTDTRRRTGAERRRCANDPRRPAERRPWLYEADPANGPTAGTETSGSDAVVRRAVAVTVVALTIGLVCHLLLAATAVAGGNTAVASLAVGGYATAAASGLYAAWRALCHTRLAASG